MMVSSIFNIRNILKSLIFQIPVKHDSRVFDAVISPITTQIPAIDHLDWCGWTGVINLGSIIVFTWSCTKSPDWGKKPQLGQKAPAVLTNPIFLSKTNGLKTLGRRDKHDIFFSLSAYIDSKTTIPILGTGEYRIFGQNHIMSVIRSFARVGAFCLVDASRYINKSK